jgi:hypothetical protein
MKKILITSFIITSVALTFNSFSVKADDCSISINSKESVKCLERKVSILEKKLEQSKNSQFAIPKGAIIDFNGKTCPNGWGEYKANKKGFVNYSSAHDIVKCQKS